MVICGVNDNKLRERFLRETEISLTKVIQLGQAEEKTKIYTKQPRGESETLIYQVSQKPNVVKCRDINTSVITNCKFCGGSHKRGNCLAYGKGCYNCHKKNHFSKLCYTTIPDKNNENLFGKSHFII